MRVEGIEMLVDMLPVFIMLAIFGAIMRMLRQFGR